MKSCLPSSLINGIRRNAIIIQADPSDACRKTEQRPHIGDHHIADTLPVAGPVDHGGLQRFFGHGLQTRIEDDKGKRDAGPCETLISYTASGVMTLFLTQTWRAWLIQKLQIPAQEIKGGFSVLRDGSGSSQSKAVEVERFQPRE